jgi:NADPH:quinone reductase-like Zn-dependent oxidoreductase
MAGASACSGRPPASSTPASVRAAVLHRYGTPRCGLFQDPVSTGEQIVLDVCAAGVNHFDVMMGLGTSYAKPDALPYVVGLDGVGRLPDGRRVYFESTVAPYGAAAERTLVEPEAIVELPPGLDDAVAAALGNCGLAAWLSLEWRAKLTAGETVLVLGATGTVGRLAVQVAKLLGAGRVIATGRNRERLRRADELGADACVALEESDTLSALREAVGPGADVVLDLLWGPPAALGAQVAASGARFVQVGALAGAEATLDAGVVRQKSLAILGYANYHVPREERRAAYLRLADHAAAGRIAVDLERLALEQVTRAWERQLSGTPSKLVLVPGAPS